MSINGGNKNRLAECFIGLDCILEHYRDEFGHKGHYSMMRKLTAL